MAKPEGVIQDFSASKHKADQKDKTNLVWIGGKKSQMNDRIAYCDDRLLIIALIVFFPCSYLARVFYESKKRIWRETQSIELVVLVYQGNDEKSSRHSVSNSTIILSPFKLPVFQFKTQ